MRRIWLILAMLLTLVLPARTTDAARIQWYVEVLEDPISKKPVIEARVLTALGYHFDLRRREDNSIWAHFELPRSVRTMFSSRRLPTYWIDDNDPINLEQLKALEIGFTPTLYKVQGQELDFIVWGAAQPGFIPPVIRQMMLGETLYVKYWSFTEDEALAEIPLRRANEAIAQFLRVPPLDRDNAKASGPATTFEVVARRYMELCGELRFSGVENAFTECRDQFVVCSERPDQTVDSLKACLGYEP